MPELYQYDFDTILIGLGVGVGATVTTVAVVAALTESVGFSFFSGGFAGALPASSIFVQIATWIGPALGVGTAGGPPGWLVAVVFIVIVLILISIYHLIFC